MVLQLSKKAGVITVEVLIGLSLFLIVFVALFHILFTLWVQVRVEDQALILARQAAVTYQPVGTIHEQDVFGGRGTAEIRWDASNVFVRVELDISAASAERLMPRELP